MADYITYKNLSEKSSTILSYKILNGTIEINFKALKFNSKSKYIYHKNQIGSVMFETMKQLAKAGQGLNSFINSVKPKYFSKS